VPQLDLYLFGTPRTEIDSQAVNIPRRKAIALFAYLALTGRGHNRDALATLLWPENGQSSARAELRRTLWVLNHTLGKGWLVTDRETAGLNPELNATSGAGLWLDVVEFQRQLKACEAHEHLSTETCPDCIPYLESAVDLYTDHFMAGFSLPDSPAYDEWQFFQTESLRSQLASALVRLSTHYSTVGDHDVAITYARRWLKLDPFHEPAHQQLMTLFAQSGQRAAALRQYETCRQVLADEFGVEPGDETQSLYQRIRDRTLISGSDSHPKNNLPLELTSFIGRQDEIVQVRELLQANRLVTLTGSGGVGKTRLSIRVVEDVLDQFPDGVWYIELAPLADPALVVQTVALSIGLREAAGRPFEEVLVAFLRSRQASIVLDNCEHLIEACARLADTLLRGCPQLKLLATSREALGVAGEAVFEVPSLGLPESDEVLIEKMEAYDAVRLFVTRAQAALPGFQVTSENASSVVRICRRLDGIPLALELAAARLKILTTEQLSTRLEDSFHLLTGGSRTALPRQQTLWATIDWSYQILDGKERILLQRLAVFAGGFSLEGVEAVCAGDNLAVWEIFDLLASLVDKSMVNADRAQGAETRYRLLETVRQYAREKLLDAGESEQLRTRHLEYYAVFAEEAYPHLHGAGRLEWTRRMKREYDNIREAIEWAFQDAARAHLGLYIITNIADRFLDPMGHYRAGVNWLKTGLIIAGESIPKLLKAQVYFSLCTLDKMSEPDHFQKIRKQCIQLCREIGPQAHRELSLALGWHVLFTSQERALADVEEAVQIAREMGPPGRWALTGTLAIKAFISTYYPKYVSEKEAYAAALESVQLAQTGDRWHTFAYVTLGIVETRRGQFDQARQYLQRALDLQIEIEANNGTFVSYDWLAWHYRQARQADLAMYCCQDMYKLLDWLPWHTDVFFYTLGMVLLICQSNTAYNEVDPTGRDGLRFIALWDKISNRIMFMYDQDEYEQTLEQLRGQLGEAVFQAIWSEGQAMTLDEGVEYAGALLEKYAPKEDRA